MSAADGQTLAVIEFSEALLHRQHMHKIDDHAAVDIHKRRIVQFFCHRAEARALKMRALRCEEADILPLARDVKDLAQRQLFQAVGSLDRVAFAVRARLDYGETNNVIRFFERELARVGRELREQEDSLRDYSVENLIINYDEQTKHIAILSRDFELRYEETRLNLNSSESLRKTPKNSVTINAEMVTIPMYSPTKNRPNFIPEYSMW